MKEIKFLFKKMAEYEPMMFLLIILYSISSGISPFVWIITPAYIIENSNKAFSSFFIFFVGLFIITSIINFLNSFVMGNYRMRMNNIRYTMMREITAYSLSLSFSKQQDKGEVEKINNATKAVDSPFAGAGGMMMSLPGFIGMLISGIGFLRIFSTMNHLLLLIIIVLTILSGAIYFKIPIAFEKMWESMSSSWNQINKLNYEFKNPMSKQDILMFDIYSLVKQYFNKVASIRLEKQNNTNRKVTKYIIISKGINLIRDGCIFYRLIISLLSGEIPISNFYMYFTALFSFILFNDRFIGEIAAMAQNKIYFAYFFEIMNKQENNEYEKIKLDNADIEFVNVSFKYPSSDKYVLKNINFKLENNQTVALVGENGAGKSTLALILAGLYKPTSGKILLNGMDIEDMNINFNDLISAIFQDTLILPFSVRENVLMNSINENVDEIYKKTGVDNITKNYDKKDEQMLLRTLSEDGVDISGGQKQRLFLARALNKKSAKILILDEPTAQLDALAERDLYRLYDELTDDKSSIFISHRLASTKFCDKVIFLKNGEIAEEGTHDELMKLDGYYRELYDLQAKNYKEEI